MTKTTIKQIKKRNGRIVKFNPLKIINAMEKAFRAIGEKDGERVRYLGDKVMEKLEARYDGKIIPQVEEIQDLIEEVLMHHGHYDVARAYILYRDLRSRVRDVHSLIDSDELVGDYLAKLDWRVRENSNMAYSLQGLNNHVASVISANYWLNKIYPPQIREAHTNGDLHIHNLQILAAYCCGWDLRDLLFRGFGGVVGKVECKPPKHFRTALGQLVNFFYTLQGESAGAQAISSFDTLLAPFIAYDHLSYKEVKQALQEFVFNMNVPTRVGFQTPFTNVTLDLNIPTHLAKEPVLIGGKTQDKTYGDFQKEVDSFNKAFAEVMLEGDAKGRVFTFPIPTYNITKDFAWNNPNYEGIWEMTRKYGIPYFSNFVNSDMKPEDARSMCPLAGDEKVLIKSSRGRDLEYSEIKNIYEGNGKNNEYEIYSDGDFVKGVFNKFENQKMIKVTLENGHEIKISEEHLNFVTFDQESKTQELKGKELKKGMFLPYSLKMMKGSGGNRDLGYFVGAYAGDGSFDGETTVIFSLENEKKKQVITRLQKISEKYFGAHWSVSPSQETKLFTLKIHSKAAVGLCQDFVSGKEREKYYSARIFGMSQEFREGVITGHYATDGGNRHRIYTSSKKMVETLNMLAATLGTTTSIYRDNRQDRFGKETNYAVLVYQLNRKKYGDIWFKKDKKLWVKIKSIEQISNSTAYCFEVKNGRPMFTVGTTGILTHNCRLRLDNRELAKRGGGLFGAYPLTGSLGVITINLPRIGYLAKNKKEYFEKLSHLMDLAKEATMLKRTIVEQFTDEGLYPYSKVYLGAIKDRFGEYWKNHFNTIGLIGMNESLLNFMGKTIGDEEGKAFAQEILDFMRTKLLIYQKETDQMFNLEATPAEGTSYHLAKLDKKAYPDIICANEEEIAKDHAEPFYTNSTHLPVNFTDDLFEALNLQDDLQTKYTGGTVLHGFLGESLPDTASVKNLVQKIAQNYHLPYYTLTPTFSICPSHGYLKGEQKTCPECGKTCEVWSRIVGYLRPVVQWNAGKQAEFVERQVYQHLQKHKT
ncbi:MAG: ribonucleoside triphosphate reductase [Patescibacteria group bacterium]|nr:ribonucleoside triphosphate reductase [Patescibacteria group bacterium]MCL5095747.1 ribonucleoside triphosphate reductase [Patescibacteria group bacterium]